MARQSGLGKGLGSLIPSDIAGVATGDQPRLEEIPVGSVIPNPHQPRVHFDEESLAELAASVRRDDDGTERNAVKTFEVIGKDEPEADTLAPVTEG